MKTFIASLAIALTATAAPLQAQELTAEEIIKQADERYTGDSSQADARLILIDKRGRERVRDIRLYSLEKADVEKTVSFFLSPTEVAGTAYMNYDYEAEQDDDSWLYLPALKQVRRVAAGDKSGSFMGSDFTFSDINGVNIEWYDYTLLSDSEMVDGAEVWLIESTPKPEFAEKVADETGYEKSHLWIRKDNLVQVRAKLWVNKANRVKYFSVQDLREIDGIWTPMRMQMVTTRFGEKEHSSVFERSDVIYNQHHDEGLFTTQAMQQGVR